MVPIVVGTVCVLTIIVLVASLTRVPAGKVAVVERLGRFSRVVQPGFYFLVPYVDRVRWFVDTSEQIRKFADTGVRTLDNTPVDIEFELRFYVVDPQRAVYAVAEHGAAIEHAVTVMARRITAEKDASDLDFAHRELEREVSKQLIATAAEMGLSIERIEVAGISRQR